jgi:hypothetical protein
MQFNVTTRGKFVDLGAVERALQAVDPAAVVDRDAQGELLRVSTILSALELIDVVDRAGLRIARDQIVPLKSECCGGCGG